MASLTLNGIISYKKDDDYETSKYIWEMLIPFVSKDKTIYDPYFCSGLTKQYFNELGYDNVIHNDEDFYTSYMNYDYDIIITNPPFSNKKKVCQILKQIDKPFIIIAPVSTITKKFWRETFKEGEVSMLIPNGRMQFSKNGKQLDSCWFDCVFLTYKLNLDKQVIFLD
tara:strand:- start:214 stop:717 length:504 start_codon:yes stop_codon:yes gene_type:complete